MILVPEGDVKYVLEPEIDQVTVKSSNSSESISIVHAYTLDTIQRQIIDTGHAEQVISGLSACSDLALSSRPSDQANGNGISFDTVALSSSPLFREAHILEGAIGHQGFLVCRVSSGIRIYRLCHNTTISLRR